MESHTRKEILSQPSVWAAAQNVLQAARADVQTLLPMDPRTQVVFTGCGSTYYLSLAAASLFSALTGRSARAAPASELWLNPETVYPQQAPLLLIAVSRSGETSETLRACEQYLERKLGNLLTLSCYPDRPLARMGQVNLVFPASQEQSVVQTRSFSTLHLAVVTLAAWASGRENLLPFLDRLPDAGERVLAAAQPLVSHLGQDSRFDRFYYLGSGPRYGLAAELALKMKETSLSHSEAFHFLEFRHGPMAMAAPSALLIGLRSENHRAREGAVLQEMKARGARTLAMDEQEADLPFQSGLPPEIRDVLYLPAGQLLAWERAVSRGLDPDHPQHLEAVVRLKEG